MLQVYSRYPPLVSKGSVRVNIMIITPAGVATEYDICQ